MDAQTDPLARPSAEALRPADRAFVLASHDEVVAVHANESSWWNHGSFLLPLLGAVVCLAGGLLFRVAELTGFGVFLAVIAAFMLPVALLTWRSTATAIVLTSTEVVALHDGRVQRSVRWDEMNLIDRVDTLGNIRWRIHPREGQHLAIEGEIADVPGLLEEARRLSGYSGAHQPAG